MHFGALKSKQNAGYGLVELLVVVTISSITMYAFQKMFAAHHMQERGLASNTDMTELIILTQTMLQTSDVCKKTGLIGVDLSTLVVPSGSPSPTPVAVTLNLGGYVIAAGATSAQRTREVLAFDMTQLTEINASQQLYLGTLNLQTGVQGKAQTSRDPNHIFPVMVNLDGTGKVNNCYAASTNAGMTYVGQCETNVVESTGVDESIGLTDVVKETCTCPGASFMMLTGQSFYDDNWAVSANTGSGKYGCGVENQGTGSVDGYVRINPHVNYTISAKCEFSCFR